ncbi:transmembrane protein 53-like [Culicoides brevitarsis]|uniref:transmembrane protein 53-like n=1 Tax=Culicoides brevitarsis TaxID=469753 RepID=UPI00307B17A1
MTKSLGINLHFPESDVSKTTPVVLLLGWAGCQDRYLQKYSKIYEDKGLIVVRYCGPVSHVFWDKPGLVKAARDIAKYLKNDSRLDGRPLFLHLFSNGGAFLNEHLSMCLKNEGMTLKGIIYDSAPGERRVKTLFHVMQEIFGKMTPIGPLIAAIIFSLLFCMYILQMFYYKTKEILVGYTPGSDPFRALCEQKTINCPHLLFYSKKDNLILAPDVEHFASCREKLGNKVTKVCFDDSEHVRHFMKHPEVYKNSIDKFMEECLKN